MPSNRTPHIALSAILLLFFLQVLSDFIQSIYAFGLLVTAFTIQLAAVLLLFSPLALLFVRRRPTRPWLLGLAAVAILGRLLEPLLDPGSRLVACGISVGSFMLLFPGALAVSIAGLAKSSDDERRSADDPLRLRKSLNAWPLAWGLLLAVMLLVFLRTAGSSLDISELGLTQLIAWLLGALAVWLLWTMDIRGRRSAEASNVRLSAEAAQTPSELGPRSKAPALTHEERRAVSLRALEASAHAQGQPASEPAIAPSAPRADGAGSVSTGRVVALCIGLASVVITLYFGLATPTVIARWTGYSFISIVSALCVVWAGSAWVFRGALPSRTTALVWNALFVLMLVLTILPHQIALPSDSHAFPLYAPAVSSFWQIPLVLMLALSPVIFFDFLLYLQSLSAERPSLKQLGGGFSFAALFILVMVFLHVFTTIYDYAQPIGSLFRDRFWLVYLLAGLGLALPMLLVHPDRQASPSTAAEPVIRWAITALAIMSIAAAYLTMPRPPQTPASTGVLTVMTYNIQQGFDKAGNTALPAQLKATRLIGPDVLGVEESDTARIANGNVDAVRYFADNLGMYSYYGPTTTVGTFGIALLSKYPIRNPQTFFMYSKGEQTACIEAQIVAYGRTYNVFVTHLGNDGPVTQVEDVLERVQSKPNVILMGDFNFDPTMPQYGLVEQTLYDAWLQKWPSGQKVSGYSGEGRIDLIFVTPGTQISDSHYVNDGSSDHPYLYAVIKP